MPFLRLHLEPGLGVGLGGPGLVTVAVTVEVVGGPVGGPGRVTVEVTVVVRLGGPGRVTVVVRTCNMFAVHVSIDVVTSGGAGSKITVVRVIVTLIVTVLVGMISKRHCKSSAWDRDVNAMII